MAMLLDVRKLSKFDEYFNSEEFSVLTNGVTLSAKQILVLGMSNLKHKRYEINTHIFIDPVIVYPGTQLKIVDLCKIINYGNLSINGYSIISDVFNHFSEHIKGYVNKHLTGLS